MGPRSRRQGAYLPALPEPLLGQPEPSKYVFSVSSGGQNEVVVSGVHVPQRFGSFLPRSSCRFWCHHESSLPGIHEYPLRQSGCSGILFRGLSRTRIEPWHPEFLFLRDRTGPCYHASPGGSKPLPVTPLHQEPGLLLRASRRTRNVSRSGRDPGSTLPTRTGLPLSYIRRMSAPGSLLFSRSCTSKDNT